MIKFLFLLWMSVTAMFSISCQSTAPDPVQRLYNDNQNAQQVRAQRQAVQDGLNRYQQQNQQAAQRSDSVAPPNKR